MMTLDELFKLVDGTCDDYIVRLRYKYTHENEYTVRNELLTVEDPYTFSHTWLYDWYEGQQDVIVDGYIKVSDVKVTDLQRGTNMATSETGLQVLAVKPDAIRNLTDEEVDILDKIMYGNAVHTGISLLGRDYEVKL